MSSGVRKRTVGLVCSEPCETLYRMSSGLCAGAPTTQGLPGPWNELGSFPNSWKSLKGLKHKTDIILFTLKTTESGNLFTSWHWVRGRR